MAVLTLFLITLKPFFRGHPQSPTNRGPQQEVVVLSAGLVSCECEGEALCQKHWREIVETAKSWGRFCAQNVKGNCGDCKVTRKVLSQKRWREIVETVKSWGRFCAQNVKGNCGDCKVTRKVLSQKRWREIVETSHEEGFVPKILREIVEIARSQGRAIFGVALGLHNLSCCGRVWPTWRVWVGCWQRWWRRCVTQPSSWRPSCPSTASRRQRRCCGGSPWAWTTTPTAWPGWARVTATLCWPHTWVTGWRWGGKLREGRGVGGEPTVSHMSYRVEMRGEMERGKCVGGNQQCHTGVTGWRWGGSGGGWGGENQQRRTGVTGWRWGGSGGG